MLETSQATSRRKNDPRKRFNRLLVEITLLAGYLYLYIYQSHLGIKIPYLGYKQLLTEARCR